MTRISTHVLDAVFGKPAAGISVRLDRLTDNGWAQLNSTATDADGRCAALKPDADAGTYRIVFDTQDYLGRLGRTSIYPEISITFHCDGASHYHLPLLLSDNSYTTYRGS
jgi:5-hydroxyisourate hydrolase